MVDPTLGSAIGGALEMAVNAALRYDPASRLALSRLAGRVLAVQSRQPDLVFYLLPEAEGLRVQAHYEGPVETRLVGSPIALASLLKSERLNLAGSGVEVHGGTGLLQELQRILHGLDIDWEEALSEVVGDVAAHQGTRSLRSLGSWLAGRRSSFERLLGEYLSEELNTTPARAELEHFYRHVDELRFGTDRLAARVEALLARNERNERGE